MAIVINKNKLKKAPEEDEPKKKSKKLPEAVVEGENEDDETTLAESRPLTAKDQRKALKKKSLAGLREKKLVAKARQRIEDPDEEDEELTEDEIEELIERSKRVLRRYGGVALTPTNKHTGGLRKGGLRVAKYAVPDADHDDLVRVVMLRTVDPAPRVGNVNVLTDHGHEKLERGETYNLPHVVAVHLAECRAGTMIDD